jgi:RNA polymerase sigma-70 factor (ECF subfamily)
VDAHLPDELFARHHRALFRFAYRMTGRRDVAEDIVQDVFVRVMQRLEQYEPREREAAWLFTIARRLLLDRRRETSRRPPESIGDPDSQSREPDQELALTLDQAFAIVPVDEREAFLLREVAGLGYQEIAAACQITPAAARSRIYRARVHLRAVLSSARVLS